MGKDNMQDLEIDKDDTKEDSDVQCSLAPQVKAGTQWCPWEADQRLCSVHLP